MDDIFVERFKSLRKDSGLSQVQLANELDLSSGFIADIELGTTQISVKNLVAIADFFDTSPDYLLGYKDIK